MDLSWFVTILFIHEIITNIASRSLDGLTLYAASSDGTIAVFQFDSAELEGIASKEDHEQYLDKFEFIPPPLPEGYSHFGTEDAKATLAPSHQGNGFDSRAASN